MSKQNYHFSLSTIYKNIKYYKKMVASSQNPRQKAFYQGKLYNERVRLTYLKNHCYRYMKTKNQAKQSKQSVLQTSPEDRVFTIEELQQFDGANGAPAYVAINGVVYDVSLEATWGGGTHFSLYAGKDLTAQFNGCHQGIIEVLRNLPKIGVLKNA